jgi:hypothetical protein
MVLRTKNKRHCIWVIAPEQPTNPIDIRIKPGMIIIIYKISSDNSLVFVIVEPINIVEMQWMVFLNYKYTLSNW